MSVKHMLGVAALAAATLAGTAVPAAAAHAAAPTSTTATPGSWVKLGEYPTRELCEAAATDTVDADTPHQCQLNPGTQLIELLYWSVN